MPETGAGWRALRAMDAVIAARPEADGPLLSEAMADLVKLRDGITPPDWARASTAERGRLSRLNAVISVVMGLHFPVGAAPWDDFVAARAVLASLLDEPGALAAIGQ